MFGLSGNRPENTTWTGGEIGLWRFRGRNQSCQRVIGEVMGGPFGLVPDAADGHAELAALKEGTIDLIRDAHHVGIKITSGFPLFHQGREIIIGAIRRIGILADAIIHRISATDSTGPQSKDMSVPLKLAATAVAKAQA